MGNIIIFVLSFYKQLTPTGYIIVIVFEIKIGNPYGTYNSFSWELPICN